MIYVRSAFRPSLPSTFHKPIPDIASSSESGNLQSSSHSSLLIFTWKQYCCVALIGELSNFELNFDLNLLQSIVPSVGSAFFFCSFGVPDFCELIFIQV